MNSIRKFILAVAATAVAISVMPALSFAKTSHKAKAPYCTVGQACMDKPDKNGWGAVTRCSYEGTVYRDFSPCNVRSGMCPTAICKPKKKKK